MVAKARGVTTPVAANRGGIRPVRGARPTGVREELEELHEEGAWTLWMRNTVRETPSWLVSMIFHMIVLLVLAMWTLPTGLLSDGRIALTSERPEEPDLFDPQDDPVEAPDSDLPEAFGDLEALSSLVFAGPKQVAAYEPEVVVGKHTVSIGEFDFSRGLPFGDPLAKAGPDGGGGKGRIKSYRDLKDKPEGAAVAEALKWLAAHQLPDGSWSFDHTRAAGCGGKCPNAGKLAEARTGATAIALLSFLGAGQTQREGRYKETVERGLAFVGRQMDINDNGGSLYEPGGRMYSHGLAAIALCEAYALTHDKRLHLPAQAAINFTCYAQDPVGGGWRYEPRQKGDTSAFGWQIMALKSGHMAYLRVPTPVIKKAFAYLDTVQYESGARYGYLKPGQGSSATTAIGLLCRMYLGWKKDNPALQRGVQWISEQGPAPGDMYYNYYATQVMRHWEGPLWKKWDEQMRPQLLDSQAKAGHEKGSWFFKHHHSDRGGRLYCTAMAAMTLEVYYRISPIYGNQSIEDDFPE